MRDSTLGAVLFLALAACGEHGTFDVASPHHSDPVGDLPGEADPGTQDPGTVGEEDPGTAGEDEPGTVFGPTGTQDEFLPTFTLPAAPTAAIAADGWQRTEEAIEDGLDIVREQTQQVIDARVALAGSAPLQTVGLAVCAPGIAAYVGGQSFATVDAAAAVPDAVAVVLICPGTHPTHAEVQPWVGAWRVFAPVFPGTRPVLTGQGAQPILTGSWDSSIVALGLDFDAAETGIEMSWGGTLVLAGSRFTHMRNAATQVGSDVAQAIVVGNTADGGGTAEHGFMIEALSLLFLANSAFDHVSSYEAGGAQLTAFEGFIVANSFVNNDADYEGGGLEAYHETFPSQPNRPELLAIVGNHFEGNHSGYEGGGLELGIRWTTLHALLVGNVFINNLSGYANALNCTPEAGSAVTLIGDTFIGSGTQSEALGFGGWTPVTPTLIGVTFQ